MSCGPEILLQCNASFTNDQDEATALEQQEYVYAKPLVLITQSEKAQESVM